MGGDEVGQGREAGRKCQPGQRPASVARLVPAMPSMMNVVICLLVLSSVTAMAVHHFRSARRYRAEHAGWKEFEQGHTDLDGELDRIWNRL